MSSTGQAFDLMRERESLLIRCDLQRLEIAETVDRLQGPLKIIDRAIEGVNFLRGHPVVVGLAVAVMVVMRPRGALRWLRRGFFLWRAFRAFNNPATS